MPLLALVPSASHPRDVIENREGVAEFSAERVVAAALGAALDGRGQLVGDHPRHGAPPGVGRCYRRNVLRCTDVTVHDERCTVAITSRYRDRLIRPEACHSCRLACGG